jgi:hypothetical protein
MQGRTRAVRREDALPDQRSQNPASLPVPRASNRVHLATRQLATMENRLENPRRLCGKLARPDFLFSPDQDARAQAVGLDEALHEVDLVDTDREEEARELGERFLAERSPPVEVVPANRIAVGEQGLVLLDVAREASRADQTAPVSRMPSNVACDMRRATRPFPSRNGCIQSSR